MEIALKEQKINSVGRRPTGRFNPHYQAVSLTEEGQS